MTKKYWFFPAIACIPLAMLGEAELFLLGLSLYGCWLTRIFLLEHKATLKATIIISLLFGSTLFWHRTRSHTCLDPADEKFLVYSEVTSVQVNGDRLRFRGYVQTAKQTEKVIVNYKLETAAEKEKWLKTPVAGYLVALGELKEPAEPSNFHQFNYKKYLKRQNIHWQLQAKSLNLLNPATLARPKFHFIEQIRFQIFNYIDRTFHSNVAVYLKTLLFADKRQLSEDVLQNYRSIGVIHLFSISGFHIAYLTETARRLFLRLGITHESVNWLILILLPLYGALAGFGVSVLRAVFQTIFLLVGKINHQEISTLDAWSLAMLCALFLNPRQIFSVSFQLSYLLSGLFIVVGNLSWVRKLPPVKKAFLFSLLSSLASLPILTYHFFEISWLTLFANLLFIPVFTYLLFPSLLLLFVVSPFLKATVFFSLGNYSLTAAMGALESGLTFINNQVDFSFIIGRLPNLVQMVLIWLLFKIVVKIEQKKLPSILSVSLVLGSLFYYQLSPVGYVLLLDVGQGDSVLIKEPGTGKVTLIDTGGSLEWFSKATWQEQENPFTVGEDVIVPALKALGISQIDRLYLTHADMDHVGEIETIGKWLSIQEIVATEATIKEELVARQIETLKKTQVTNLAPPVALAYPTESTLALFPFDSKESTNNDSLTLYVKIGKDTWLFTGDLESEGERRLVSRYPNLRTDYLKVAHHGSKTSTSELLLDHITAKQAFISAGRNNSYSHPHPEVVERLMERDLTVFTTADDGAIMIQYLKRPFLNEWFTKIKTAYKN